MATNDRAPSGSHRPANRAGSPPTGSGADRPTTGTAVPGEPAASAEKTKHAGALDIRTIIGGLIGAYGVILLLMGLFATDESDTAKANGANLNLWTGVGLLAAGILFLLWVRLRPLEVPAEAPTDQDEDASENPR